MWFDLLKIVDSLVLLKAQVLKTVLVSIEQPIPALAFIKQLSPAGENAAEKFKNPNTVYRRIWSYILKRF